MISSFVDTRKLGIVTGADGTVKLVPGLNACLRCGAEVRPKPWGCKNPCPNCGFVYPLGDCAD